MSEFEIMVEKVKQVSYKLTGTNRAFNRMFIKEMKMNPTHGNKRVTFNDLIKYLIEEGISFMDALNKPYSTARGIAIMCGIEDGRTYTRHYYEGKIVNRFFRRYKNTWAYRKSYKNKNTIRGRV